VLETVRQHERHLGSGGRIDSFHASHAHHRIIGYRDQSKTVDIVCCAKMLSLMSAEVRVTAEEPPVDSPEAQPLMELHQCHHVAGLDGSNPDHRAVTQDCVRHFHHFQHDWSWGLTTRGQRPLPPGAVPCGTCSDG